MSIRIDREKCIGCKKCSFICPGNLIYMEGGKASIKYKNDCWSCGACMKECCVQAIQMYIPKELGGKGGYIETENKGGEIIWTIKTDVEECSIKTNRKESNKY